MPGVMKYSFKNYFKMAAFLLWPLALFLMTAGFYKRPSGFHLENIRSDFTFPETRFLNADFSEFDEAFLQEYTYLGKGAQCYAFVSQDQKYVIKFFKMKHLTPKYWLKYVPLPWLEKYRLEKVDRRERRREEILESFKMAQEELSGRTGLLLAHFRKTNFQNAKLNVIDKHGKKHTVPLNEVAFILQKKAEMIYPHVAGLMRDGKRDAALQALVAVLNLVKERCQKGIADKDPGISGNYGFIENQPVHIDTGMIVREESLKEPINYLREVLRVSRKMDVWLQQHYPELCQPFQEEVYRILSQEDTPGF